MATTLYVIVDATHSAWAPLDAAASTGSLDSSSNGGSRRLSFPELVRDLQVFVASFLALRRHNRVVALGYNGVVGGFCVLPPREAATAAVAGVSELARAAAVQRALAASLWMLRFGAPPTGVAVPAARGAAGNIIGVEWPESPQLSDKLSSFSSCLTLALLHGAQHAGVGGARMRIIVFQAGADVAAHYIPVNNAVSAAAARGVLIDGCVLGTGASVFLQQAAQSTRGRYAHPPAAQHAALSPYLSELFLADASVRALLLQPPPHSVNLRAHCFCHKRPQSLAWLCTTCLSVWCENTGRCDTCG